MNTFPSKKVLRISYCFSALAFFLGSIALAWCLLYTCHTWHDTIFCMPIHNNDYQYSDFAPFILIAISVLLLFLIYFLFLRKKNCNNKLLKITYTVVFALYNCAALSIITLFICDSFHYNRGYNNIRLDNQLTSEDVNKFHESIDSIIARSIIARSTGNYDLYRPFFFEEDSTPNDYIMLAARRGYAPAQYYVGTFFHEQAKIINNHRYGHNSEYTVRWNNSMTEYCQEQLNRATYWWLKAAEQGHEKAQRNLGRLWMKSLLGTQHYSYLDAKYWLTEATKNGDVSAYYYLGMLYRDTNLSEAAQYFKIGAAKGNEKCMEMLENPDFIDIELDSSSPRLR